MRYKPFYCLVLIMVFAATPCLSAVDTVMVVDFNFQPPSLTIAPGDTVRWIVGVTCCGHTVTRTASPAWDSGPLNSGDTFERAFPVCGTYDYFCTPHRSIGMVGRVKVVQAGAPGKGDMNANGSLSAADVVLLLNCVFSMSGNCDLCFADVNCSGGLSAADVVLELNVVFVGAAFPC